MKLKELEEQYQNSQAKWKAEIKLEPNKHKRFWKWVWYLIAFPFVWIFYNLRDWRTILIFLIVVAIVSCEVWIPYIIGFIAWNNEALRISMFSIGSACWLFWLAPATPFLVICVSLTIGIKAIFNKVKACKKKNKDLL